MYDKLVGTVALLATLFTRPHPTKPGQTQVRPTVKVASAVVTAGAASWLVIATPFVAGFEGYYGHVYRDSVGVKTICYGQTASDGADFSKVYTKQECLDLLERDLPKYQAQVRRCIPKEQPPHREAALVSFAYNLGPGAVCGPVGRYINAGNIIAGCNAMLAYDHAGGRVLAGLTRRRQAERAMCLRND